ncbi:hypothetical protein VB773_19920 [Haloarculaceae archaeon H-GB2-1]|nr:hypothetical protein [Haloarculaceae archaeon H-GB2-1]
MLQQQADAFQSYQTVSAEGRIVPIRDFTSIVPCRHQRLGYRIGKRYDELVRSPNNIAVTTSQYLLREVADDEDYSSAKMLSFADSHRDMKELGRDFNEPEVATLLDQAIVEAVRTADGSWASLNDVLAESLACIDALHDDLSPPRNLQDVTFDLKEHLVDRSRRFMDTEVAIRDRTPPPGNPAHLLTTVPRAGRLPCLGRSRRHPRRSGTARRPFQCRA